MKITTTLLRYTKKISRTMSFATQNFDYFYVMDFEATCEKDKKIEPQEIIEFPCIKICGKTFEEISRFHRYVKPIANPYLSPFCIELTGINQSMVYNEETFEKVFNDFNEWIKEEKSQNKNFTFVTCGDWDLKVMLREQCNYSNIQIPSYFNSWINIKKSCHKATRKFPKSLHIMLNQLGLEFQGRPHSGIDDTLNIVNALRVIASKKYVFQNTSFI